jgi:hypothetical protein
MPLLCLCYSTEAIFILGDDEYVCGRYRRNIPKSNYKLVLKDDAGGYLFLNDFVKDGLAHNDNGYI